MTRSRRRLHVPAGTTEANVGPNLYTADADGVIVPTESDFASLLSVAGFTADADDAPPLG